MFPVVTQSVWKSFGLREWISIISIITLDFIMGIGDSFQGPLYPAEAVIKGSSPSIYGAVFGFYYLTFFICTPLMSIFMLKGLPGFGLRRCLLVTFFIDGVCLILYGMLDLIESSAMFALASFVLRGADGIGSSGFSSYYIILSLIFPERIALIVGLSESLFYLAMSIGPVLGEFFYEVFDYMVPFLGLGILQLTLLLFVCCCLPEIPKVPTIDTSVKDVLFQFFKLLQEPRFLLFFVTTIVTSFGSMLITATLEEFLKQFELRPLSVGLMFMLIGLPQMLGPAWGYLVSKLTRSEIIAFIGFVIATIGITLFGEIPFSPYRRASERTIRSTGLGLITFGFGQGALIGSNFYNMERGSQSWNSGSANSLVPSVIGVSGFYVAATTCGGMLGPTIGGILFQHCEFDGALTVLWCMYSFMAIMILLFSLCNCRTGSGKPDISGKSVMQSRRKENARDETQPLLITSDSILSSISIHDDVIAEVKRCS